MSSERRTFWMGSTDLTRRQLLAAGAVGAAGAMVTSGVAGASIPLALSNPAGPRPNTKAKAGTDQIPQIKHIIVVMMENHSYDNVLGANGRAGAEGLTFAQGIRRAQNSNPDGKGGSVQSFEMPTTVQDDGKPSQAWGASWTQFTGSLIAQSVPTDPSALNQGFVISDSQQFAMGYFTPSQLPFINSLASTFPVADRWFASCLAQTYPNRRFMMAGTASGFTYNSLSMPTGGVAPLPENGTIQLALMQYGISWKNYYCDSAASYIMLQQATKTGFGDHVAPISNYFADCVNGTLPSVSFVDPNFGEGSQENPQDAQHGDAFLHDVVTAAINGKNWDSTMLVYLYDEHGGYYDHVAPPTAPLPDGIAPFSPTKGGDVWNGRPNLPNFKRLGFRVPAGVVSPFAKANYVSHTTYDHTSVLKLIEQKWNLPSFTPRDAWAASPLDMIDTVHWSTSFKTPPALARKPRDTAGNLVSTMMPGDTAPTASEVQYPDDGRQILGKGFLRRRQFYTDRNGNDKATETPFYQVMKAAWSAPNT